MDMSPIGINHGLNHTASAWCRLGHAYYASNNNYIAQALVPCSCAIDNAFCCIFLLFTLANFKTTAMLTEDAKILKRMADVHASVADTTGHDKQNTVVFHTLNGTFHTIHHEKCSGLSASNTSRTIITSTCHDWRVLPWEFKDSYLLIVDELF